MKPKSGVFYVLLDRIIFVVDSKAAFAPDHVVLFPLMVDHLFPKLDPDTRRELKDTCLYGLPRGRIVAKAKRDPFTGEIIAGTLTLYGTPECKSYEVRLKAIFGLTSLPAERFTVVARYDDEHYYRQRDGMWLMEEVINENREALERLPEAIQLRGLPRRPPTVYIDEPYSIPLSEKTRAVLRDLSPRELEVLRQRFGVDHESGTLEDVGKDFFVNRERLEAIERKALKKLGLKRQVDEHTSFLKARYPDLLGDARIECAQGWMKLIAILLSKLERIRRQHGVGLQVLQIKQKLGLMRVYVEPDGVPNVEGWLRYAERMSAKTCEVCGEPGRLRSRPTKTLCDQHFQKSEEL